MNRKRTKRTEPLNLPMNHPTKMPLQQKRIELRIEKIQVALRKIKKIKEKIHPKLNVNQAQEVFIMKKTKNRMSNLNSNQESPFEAQLFKDKILKRVSNVQFHQMS